MIVDPLWRACADGARALLGPNATMADVLWSAAVTFLFATGSLSDGSVSVSLH